MNSRDYDEYCERCSIGIEEDKYHLAIKYTADECVGWVTFCSRDCLRKSILEYNAEGDSE